MQRALPNCFPAAEERVYHPKPAYSCLTYTHCFATQYYFSLLVDRWCFPAILPTDKQTFHFKLAQLRNVFFLQEGIPA